MIRLLVMATAPIEEEAIVKHVLANLREYLHNYLRVDASLISVLKRKQLLDDNSASQLDAALVSKGSDRVVDGLLDYMSSFYDGKKLRDFCSSLEEFSKPAKPLYDNIAQKIREELKK